MAASFVDCTFLDWASSATRSVPSVIEKQLSRLLTIGVIYDRNLTLREGHLDFVLPKRGPNHEQQVCLDIVGAVVDAFHPVLDLNIDSRISETFNFDGSARSRTI